MAIAKTYCPWLDRAGRFSSLKAGTLALAALPAAWLAVEAFEGWLVPQPWTEGLHQSGAWAVRFLLLSLAITPLRRVWQWGQLIAVRRMLGVTALAYAALHVMLYIGQQHGDIAHVAGEIAFRFYLTIGFAALLGLVVLGATSTDGMIRRVGGKRWQSLHRSVYAVATLGLLHFMLQAKLDVFQPVLMAGLFFLTMGWRLLQRRKLGDDLRALLGLAVASAIATALVEAGWYGVVNHLPVGEVLAANLSLDDGPRPAVIVLLAGVALVASRWGRLALVRVGGPIAGASRLRRRLAFPAR